MKGESATRKIARYGGLCLLFSLFVFQFSFAQKYPERREARFAGHAYQQGDFERAETRYRRALELRPDFQEATFNLGGALFRQEKVEEAAREWERIAADSLADAGMASAANFNLGNVMLAGQKVDEAIEFYKQALRLDPTDGQAKYNLAYAQKLKQQQEQQQNEEENQEQQNQDQNGSGGGDEQNNERPDDSEGENPDDGGENDPKDGQGEQNEGEGDDESPEGDDEGDDEGDGEGEGEGEGEAPEGEGEAKMDPGTADRMLEAIQAEENDTREKVNARQVPSVARSGKNW